MTPPLHRCIAFGCVAMIHQNQFMCRAHMRCVSAETKQEVWATWKDLREAKLSETRVEAARLHRFALQHAMQEVKDFFSQKRKAA